MRIASSTALPVLLAVVAGCGVAGSPPPPTEADTNPAAVSAVPIPSTRIDAAIAALDGIATRTMDRTGIPGMSIAVVRDGSTVYAKGFGVRTVGTDERVDADTTFQLASVSKPIGASVVAAVVGSTELAWTDPVTRYFPDFTLSDPYVTRNVTIGDLYAMRSGIPADAGDDLEELGYNRRQILQRLRYLPLSPFRAEYHYTNFGLTAAAEAVSIAMKTPWETLSKQRIYQPLGMTRTTSDYAKFLRQDNRVTLHVKLDGSWVANGNREEMAQAPAGTVSSSANDMAKWMAMELADGRFEGKQVVAAEALQASRVPAVTSHPATTAAARTGSFGYGINVADDSTGRVRYGFSGAFSQGASTTFILLPSERLGISVFTNAYPLGIPEAISEEFLELAETGVVQTDWAAYEASRFSAALAAKSPATESEPPARKSPPGPLARYVGQYANGYYGPARVSLDGDGGLVAVLGPAATRMPLRPYDGNVFAVEPAPGMVVPMATFTIENGTATTVEFASLQAPGQELFRRVGNG